MSFNQCMLIGRVTSNPLRRITTGEKPFAKFTLAVRKKHRKKGDDPDADFFQIKAWGTTADYVANYVSRGRLVAVSGRIETRSYTDERGEKRIVYEIAAVEVNPLNGPKEAEPAQSAEYDPYEDV